MAGNIKGITIEFRGETSSLEQSLRKVNTETRAIDKELRQVDKALKFNPHNVDLLRQKSELLGQKIKETRDKLQLLKDTQAKVDSGEIEMSAEDYRNLQREIITTESKLKTFEAQQKSVNNALKGMDLQQVSDKFNALGESLTNAGNAMKPFSAAGAAVVAGLGMMSYKAGLAADDLNTLSKVTGIGTGELQKYSLAADLVDVSTEDIAKANQRLKKNAYAAANGSKAQAEAFEAIGVSVTNTDGSLRSSDEIFQDVISSLGKMTNETERDALAQKLMGKTAANLNPLIEDGGETYEQVAKTMEKYGLEFVDQETLDGANEFNDALDTMKLIGSVALAQVSSQLADYLAPALEKVVDWVGQLANWLSNLSPQVLTVIGVVAGVIAVVAPVLLVLGKVAFAISSITGLLATAGVSIGALMSTLGIVIVVIAAVVAIGVLLYKNWDKIKAKAIEIKDKVIQAWNVLKSSVIALVNALKNKVTTTWNNIKMAVFRVVQNIVSTAIAKFGLLKNKVSTTFNNIKTAISDKIQAAKDAVKSAIDKIKSYFPFHIGKIISGLKLPHFKLTGKFSLKDMTVPHLSVSWYKTGGIFDSPSVIGVGEAGAEAVVPLDKFWDKLDNMQTGTNIVININGANKDPREIADEVKRMLINETNRRRLAWQ